MHHTYSPLSCEIAKRVNRLAIPAQTLPAPYSPLSHLQWKSTDVATLFRVKVLLLRMLSRRNRVMIGWQAAVNLPKPPPAAADVGRKDFGEQQRSYATMWQQIVS
jgi:hypothetical protein